MCQAGEAFVHHCRIEDNDPNSPETLWYKVCPKCKKGPIKEKLEESSVGRELGFNKLPPQKKSGVKSCSSFTWVISPEELDKQYKYNPLKHIYNEYGDKFTLKEFKKLVKECPIQYKKIGECFS